MTEYQVQTTGRQLMTNGKDTSWTYLRSQLIRGDKAYACFRFEGLIELTAIESQASLNEYNRRCDSGWCQHIGFFAMCKDDYNRLSA